MEGGGGGEKEGWREWSHGGRRKGEMNGWEFGREGERERGERKECREQKEERWVQ